MPATSYWFLGFEKRFPRSSRRPPPGIFWIKVISSRDRRFPALRCAVLSCWSPATWQMLSCKHFLVQWHQAKPEQRHRTGLRLSRSSAQPAGCSIPAGVQHPCRGWAGLGGARSAVTARQPVRRSNPHATRKKGQIGILPVLEMAEGAPFPCGYDFISHVHPAQTGELPLKECRRRRAPILTIAGFSLSFTSTQFDLVWSMKVQSLGGGVGRTIKKRIEKYFRPRSSSQWCSTL